MVESIKTTQRLFSLNQLYSGGHWSKRHKLKQHWNRIFLTYILAEMKGYKYDTFEIHVRYKGYLDVDNVSAAVKMFIDAMKDSKKITDDSPTYFKKLTIKYDSTLKKNETIFTIRDYDP